MPPKTLRDRLWRAKMKGDKHIVYRQTIPHTDQQVIVIRDVQIKIFSPVLVLKGREGEAYAYSNNNGEAIIIESHAIRRYFNRHEHIPEQECSHLDDLEPEYRSRIVKEMLIGMDFCTSVSDDFGGGEVMYYNGGVFLCEYCDGLMRAKTFVMNRQTFPDQRFRSLKSEKLTNKRKEVISNSGFEKTMAILNTMKAMQQ